MMNKVLLAVLAACIASAQQPLYGDQNKEYSGLGVYVTVLDEQSVYRTEGTDRVHGASVIDSSGDTTTFAIMPTRLNENQTKYASDFTYTITIGPTTILYSYTEKRTYTDMQFTWAESCSFSGASIAVCTTSMGGMPRPCDAGLGPGDGFPDGNFVRTATFGPKVGFKTYEIVTKTTTIKSTDPLPTTLVSGPFPEEWSAPRTENLLDPKMAYTGTSFVCDASSTTKYTKATIPAETTGSSKAALPTSSVISSPNRENATPSISIAASNCREAAHVIIAFAAATIVLAVL